MKFGFDFLVFQGGRLAEETSTTQEFADASELARAVASFGAQNCVARLDSKVIPLYSRGIQLNMPRVRDGLGPDTCLVIKDLYPIS